MPDYDGRIVIDSHIDTTRFDLDASKLFNKAKKLSDKLSISIKTKGIDLGFNINAIDNIIPKNMDKRIAEMAKYAADLGKPTLLSDIPSKFDDISNSARKATVQMGNYKNQIIDTVNALYSGEYSDKDKHTLLLSAERAQRALTRKEVIKPESILSIQDSNELNKLQDEFLSKLNESEDVIKRFKDMHISKATGLDQAKADTLGLYTGFIKLQTQINKSEAYLKELVNELIKLKENAFDMDIYEATDKFKLLLKEINAQNDKITKASIMQQSLLSGNVPAVSSAVNLPDIENTKRVFTELDKALLKMQDVLNKFSGFSIGKDDSFGKMRAEIYGISDGFEKWQSKINDAEVHIQTYLDKLNLLKSTFDVEKLSPNFDPNEYANNINTIIKEIEKYQNIIFKAKIEQDALFKGAELSGVNKASESFEKLSEETSKSSNEINKLDSIVKKVIGSISSLPSKAYNLWNAFQNSFSGIGKLFKSITRRFNWIVLGQTIRDVINDAKQSITDLRTYSSGFNNTMQSLRDSTKRVGNALATAFAPILQALAPIIANISMWITELFNKIALFTTALFTGAKTAVIADTSFSGYSKSADKATKSTKKGTKAIKDQTKALAKFDKLDVFQKDKKKTPTSPAEDIAASVPQAMRMFKTVEVPKGITDFANKLKETFKPLADEFRVVGDSFQKNFAQPVAKHIKENILPRFLESTKKAIAGMDFSRLNSSLEGFFKIMSGITKDLFDGLEWGWENVLLPMIDKTITEYLPRFLEALTTALESLKIAWDNSKGTLKKLVEWLGDLANPLIIGLLDSLKDAMQDLKLVIEIITWPIKKLGEALDSLHVPQWLKDAFYWIGRAGGGVIRGMSRQLPIVGNILKVKDFVDIISLGAAIGNINREKQKYERNQAKLQKLTFGDKYHFSNIRSLPGFASGTVVSPNRRFLAMLGDNTSEPEVVSPISTMKQAFMEAFTESGMQGGSGDVVLQLDGTTFARLMNPYNKAEQNRIGVSMVEGVAY